MAQGFAYLVAILDLYSRKVLAFRVSNALTHATSASRPWRRRSARYGAPEIFNTDQGSQFTAEDFTQPLLAKGVRVSMDGKGRWIDNVFVERLWRSVKYEDIYLHAYETRARGEDRAGALLQFLQCAPAASEPRLSNAGRDVLRNRRHEEGGVG